MVVVNVYFLLIIFMIRNDEFGMYFLVLVPLALTLALSHSHCQI